MILANNGYRIRGYIDRRKIVVNLGRYIDLICWPVCLSSRKEGDGVKGVDRGNHYLSQLQTLLYYSTLL